MSLTEERINMIAKQRVEELEEVALSIMAAGVSMDNFRINIVNFANQPANQFNNFNIVYSGETK